MIAAGGWRLLLPQVMAASGQRSLFNRQTQQQADVACRDNGWKQPTRTDCRVVHRTVQDGRPSGTGRPSSPQLCHAIMYVPIMHAVIVARLRLPCYYVSAAWGHLVPRATAIQPVSAATRLSTFTWLSHDHRQPTSPTRTPNASWCTDGTKSMPSCCSASGDAACTHASCAHEPSMPARAGACVRAK